MIRDCKGCEERRQRLKNWVSKFKFKKETTMTKNALISRLIKESQVSENSILRILAEMRQMTSAEIHEMLDMKEAERAVGTKPWPWEDSAPETQVLEVEIKVENPEEIEHVDLPETKAAAKSKSKS